MKKLTSLSLFLTSALATVFMAVGMIQTAQKLDPVAQKSLTISTMETGDVAALPCAACSGGDDTPPPPPPSGGGLFGGKSQLPA